MQRFPAALRAIAAELADADARWRPPDGSWSILEIVRHLGDEEVDDFRTRVRSTLEDPAATWPPIDPEGWARERRYNEDDLAAALDRFETERRRSLEWLRDLSDPDWSRAHEHPKLGSMRAGDVLVAWVAHDALHLRQIAKRLYQLSARDGEAYSPDYAGSW
jgi:hypothetical protein